MLQSGRAGRLRKRKWIYNTVMQFNSKMNNSCGFVLTTVYVRDNIFSSLYFILCFLLIIFIFYKKNVPCYQITTLSSGYMGISAYKF